MYIHVHCSRKLKVHVRMCMYMYIVYTYFSGQLLPQKLFSDLKLLIHLFHQLPLNLLLTESFTESENSA